MHPQPPVQYPAYGVYPAAPVAPKNPAAHALVSALVPGVGSIMAGDIAIGLTFLLSLWVAAPVVWLSLFFVAAFDAVVSMFLWMLLVLATFGGYIVGIWHGHHTATEWNRRRGVIS